LSKLPQFLSELIRSNAMQRAALILFVLSILGGAVFAQSDPASEPSVIAVSKVWPAVVNINTERIIKRTYQDPYDSMFNEFFGREMVPPRELRQKVQSLGSGFLVDPAGYIVTNEHVVERAADMKIHVTTSDGKTYEARYVSGDPSKDLALVKIEGAKPFPCISLDDLSPNMLGESVLAVGNPLGYGLSVSRGILSALNRSITIEQNEYKDLIQTDAAINPGNSGGPLIDISGKLVGVNSVKMAYTPQGVPTQGMSFAISNSTVRDSIRQLMKAAKNPAAVKTVTVNDKAPAAQRLFGLQLQDLTQDLTDAFGYGGNSGVLISDVETASPAEQAGMSRGMVIYKVGRFPIRNTREAETLFEKAKSGTVADFTVGKPQRIRGQLVRRAETVTLTAR
jgi:serine protease Do